MVAEALVRKLPPTTLDSANQPKRSIVFKFDKPWAIAHDTVNVVQYQEGDIGRVTESERDALVKNKIGTETKAKPTVDLNGRPIARIEPVDPESN